MKSIQSKIGGRSENQDFYGTTTTPYGELIVVCDGMGGHKGGRRASELAVQTILEEMQTSRLSDTALALKLAIEKANSTIWEEGRANPEYRKMGTTVVALLLTSEKAICAHVGDSRVYHLRERRILHRTFDHSHVFELVKAGVLTEEQARLSDKSNIITRALGISNTVDIDLTDNLQVQKGDRFLLCTDGIWGVIPENELIDMVSGNKPVLQTVNDLVERIDAIGFAKGGKHDNLTAALIQVESSLQHSKVENSISDNELPQLRNKLLIYLLLIVLLGSLAFNFYLVLQKKPEQKKTEKILIKKSIHKEKYQTADTAITNTPHKK